jgi:class 3 adenylate cyclase
VSVPPRTRYARSGETSIAYQVHGDGPIDLVFVPGIISHIEHLWEDPALARLFDRQAEFARFVLMDRRGMGLSDPLNGTLSLEDEVEDLTAVLDAVGSERAALHGYGGAGPFAIQFAAKHPERTSALILYAGFARTTRADDLPWLGTADERNARIQAMLAGWGDGASIDTLAPSAAGDERLRAWFARLERLSASPGGMAALARSLGDVDVRPLLGELRVPTLILHRRGDQFFDPRHATYLAERIPGAKLVWLEGSDSLPTLGDTEAFVGEIEEFLTGGRRAGAARSLLTVLFTDIVGGTERAAALGDARWRDLLAAHDGAVRRELQRFDGREVKTIGDGVLAVFDGMPSRAVRCAEAIVAATAAVGVEVRCGLHTGECERMGDDIGGMAVHIAARVSALAAPGEVLASGTTYGTVVGSGLRFEHRGEHTLKGVPGPWPLFALERPEASGEGGIRTLGRG